MFRERSFDWAIIAALSAHALSIAALGLYRREHAAPPLAPTQHAEQVELSVALIPIEVTAIAAVYPTASAALTSHRLTASTGHGGQLTNRRPTGSAAPDKTKAFDSETAQAMSLSGSEPISPYVEPQRSERRALSRSELGLAAGDYSAVMPMESPVRTAMQARLAHSRRLERSIRQGAAEHSAELGLGEEGLILAKLEQLVQGSSIGLYDKTSIAARVLPSGIVQLDLIGTTSDRAAWNRLLAQAEKELGTQVKLPKGSRGLDLELLFDSRVQLPSGTDPGVAVNLFGLPLAKGEGPRSNRIDILSSLPKLKIGDSAAVRNDPCSQQRLELDVVTSKFDLADLSGKRTRMVHARVVRRTVL